MFRNLTKDKVFFRMFFGIALPVAGQNFINFSVAMADTIMIGQLGEVQLAAINQANQWGFIMSLLIFGLGSGSNVMIAQYWGKRDISAIRKIMTVMYRLALVVTVLFTLVAVLFPYQVVGVFSSSPQVVESGARFLRVVALGYIPNGLAVASLVVLRSVGTVKISLLVSVTSLIINVSLNWALIFGNLGMPAMGIVGGAVATVVARVAELIIVLVFLFKHEKQIGYRLHMFFQKKLGMVKDYFKNATVVIVNEFLWGMGAATVTLIIGHINVEFNAAYTVCAVLSQLVSVAFNGAGSATAVIIGNTVGMGEYALAKKRAKMLILISIVVGLGSAVLMLIFKAPMLTLYNISELSKTYADQMMTVYSGIAVFQSMAMVAIVGILRGGGDGRFAAIVDVATIWLVAIPLGFLAGHVWLWAVPAVYAMLKIDEILKTLISLPRLLKGSWVKDVTIR